MTFNARGLNTVELKIASWVLTGATVTQAFDNCYFVQLYTENDVYYVVGVHK